MAQMMSLNRGNANGMQQNNTFVRNMSIPLQSHYPLHRLETYRTFGPTNESPILNRGKLKPPRSMPNSRATSPGNASVLGRWAASNMHLIMQCGYTLEVLGGLSGGTVEGSFRECKVERTLERSFN